MSSGIFVIALALLGGGILAYFGSAIGRQIGRRKISFFGLRPRYTSLLVTIAIGVFTSLFTIILIATFSQKAKTALLGYKELQSEKRKLEEEIAELSLIHGRNSALFQINEPISSGIVTPGGTYEDKEKKINEIIKSASSEVEKRYNQIAILLKRGIKNYNNKIEYDHKDFTQLLENLIYMDQSAIVLVYSEKNVYFGDTVKVKFSLYPDSLLIRKGERLLSVQLQGTDPEEKLFFSLLKFIKELEYLLEKKGMLRVPKDKPLIDIPSSILFSTLQEIREYRGWVEISAYANCDIYTTTPVEIRLSLKKL